MGNELTERDAEFENDWKDYLARERQNRYEAQSEIVKRGMRSKAEQGGTNGPAPIGYVNKRVGKRTWVETDPVMELLVKEAFVLAATGKYSVRSLSAAMAEKGLTRNGKALSPSTLHGLLTNSYYTGTLTSSKGSLPGSQVALIANSLFVKVQEQLAHRRSKPHIKAEANP